MAVMLVQQQRCGRQLATEECRCPRPTWRLAVEPGGGIENLRESWLTCPVLSVYTNGKFQLMTGGNWCSAECNVKTSSLPLDTAFGARRGTAAPLLPPAPEAGERAR